MVSKASSRVPKLFSQITTGLYYTTFGGHQPKSVLSMFFSFTKLTLTSTIHDDMDYLKNLDHMYMHLNLD